MPALPLDEAGKYVAAAYLIFLALLLIYVSIMASRLSRFEREIAELAELAKRRVESAAPPDRAAAEVPAGVGEESA
jgi:predicted S18 family serine protease